MAFSRLPPCLFEEWSSKHRDKIRIFMYIFVVYLTMLEVTMFYWMIVLYLYFTISVYVK